MVDAACCALRVVRRARGVLGVVRGIHALREEMCGGETGKSTHTMKMRLDLRYTPIFTEPTKYYIFSLFFYNY